MVQNVVEKPEQWVEARGRGGGIRLIMLNGGVPLKWVTFSPPKKSLNMGYGFCAAKSLNMPPLL